MINTVNTPRSAPHAAGHEPGVYIVREGDTLDSVILRLGITDSSVAEALIALNPTISRDGPLVAGTTLYLPPTDMPARRPAPPPAAPPVATDWAKGFGRSVGRQNVYNAHVEAAKGRWPGLPPTVLKSVLAQESGFSPSARNRYGYAGIAQLGVSEARSVGLNTGDSRMASSSRGLKARFDLGGDQRFEPARAIPGAAALLRKKAVVLGNGLKTRGGATLAGFKTLGYPEGDDYWRFVVAAYNGGEGTILRALHFAYGSRPPARVRWDDIVRAPGGDVGKSPLWRAIESVGMNPRWKYAEISEYARDVLRRARQ